MDDQGLADIGGARPATDSLKKRYLFKVGAGSFSMTLGAVAQALVPRALGPAAYGDFNFLNNFFLQVTNFLDMGTSTAFYTKLSRRPTDRSLVAFYSLFMVFSAVVVLTMTIAISSSSIAAGLWPNQSRRFILMAALLGIFLWTSLVLNKATDAYGLTVWSEIARVCQKMFGLALLIGLIHFRGLTLTSYFLYQYAIALFLAGAFVLIHIRSGFPTLSLRATTAVIKENAEEFYDFCHPLVVYAGVGLLTGIAGRWLLQRFGGSVQQGYYGLSDQVGAMCFLFTSSMTPLLMREFSIAYGKSDLNEMSALFQKHIPMLYSVTAFLCCFVSIHADHVALVLGGRNFIAATPAMTLVALAPIHQTYGQLSGSLFYATGRTGLYRNIGVGTMMLGLLASYFLLAPSSLGGLHLGAVGLAAQLLIIQFIGVNVQLYFNSRMLNLSFRRLLWHQFLCVALLLGLAFGGRLVANVIPGLGGSWLPKFAISALIYFLLSAALAFAWPGVFGITREQIKSVFR